MFGFNDMFEMFDVDFEVYIEDKLTNRKTMKAPKEMLMISFMQTVQQVANDNRAIQIKMIRPIVIYDKFENKQKTLNNEVSFKNNAMISWEETNNK